MVTFAGGVKVNALEGRADDAEDVAGLVGAIYNAA